MLFIFSYFQNLVLTVVGVVTLLGSPAFASSGSFWVNYAGDAPVECVVADGELVDYS
jgi:hypothetical protein